MKKKLQIEVHFSVIEQNSTKNHIKTVTLERERRRYRRKIISAKKTFQITRKLFKVPEEEEVDHHSNKNAKECSIIRIHVKPLLEAKHIQMLENTWEPRRPKIRTLKDIDIRFLPLTEPRIWWSENGLKAIRSCDDHKNTFIRNLTHCFHPEELQDACKEFAKELLQWIARLEHFPLSISRYNTKVREATSKEIEHRRRTIAIVKPLVRFGKSPTLQRILNIKIMLDKLWCVRFIHQDGRRPVKQKLKSVCIKPTEHQQKLITHECRTST